MDSALVSVNGHTEFFKKGISTGLKSGSIAEGRVNPLPPTGFYMPKYFNEILVEHLPDKIFWIQDRF